MPAAPSLSGPQASDPELENEIREETLKYGGVERVKIHPVVEHKQVRIFVLYCDMASAQRAHSGLHRRYFGGLLISASMYETSRFLAGDLSQPLLGGLVHGGRGQK